MKSILFVDDENQILKSLKRIFIDTEYEIFTAQTGIDALKLLRENEIHLVISDMRMPVMDGYQLLHAIKGLYPKVLRVILSGYADEKVVFKALQQNVAKVYVFKPWNNEKLIKLVEQIFETEEILATNNVLLLINNIEDIPTIKSSYQRILDLIKKEADLTDIAIEIEKDQSISTKVLQVANSAYFGMKTGSISQAVSYIGLKNLSNLIMSTSIIDSIGTNVKTEKYIEVIWKHSFYTNKILTFIYEKCLKKKLPVIASAAGLLHNIGIVLMIKNFTNEYLKIMMKNLSDDYGLIKIEKDLFKVSHQEIGGYLLKWWELPFPIIEASLYHHDPFNERVINKDIVYAVHIAQKYAWDRLDENRESLFYEESFNEIDLEKSFFESKLDEDFF
ncbi:MAG: response regulator [Clostridiales bacterium]